MERPHPLQLPRRRMSCILLTSAARNFFLGRDASFLSSLKGGESKNQRQEVLNKADWRQGKRRALFRVDVSIQQCGTGQTRPRDTRPRCVLPADRELLEDRPH